MAGFAENIPIGVFRGFGCGLSAIEEYENWLGRNVDYVLDFTPVAPASWEQFEEGRLAANNEGIGDQTVQVWQEQLGSRLLVLGVPACCMGTTWSQEAAGTNDAHWTALGERLISLGLGSCILRIGREFNGNWYNWKVLQ